MEDKMLRIGGKLHRQVKLAAILDGKTIRAWTEQALEAQLPDRARQLVDSRTEYVTEQEAPCTP